MSLERLVRNNKHKRGFVACAWHGIADAAKWLWRTTGKAGRTMTRWANDGWAATGRVMRGEQRLGQVVDDAWYRFKERTYRAAGDAVESVGYGLQKYGTKFFNWLRFTYPFSAGSLDTNSQLTIEKKYGLPKFSLFAGSVLVGLVEMTLAMSGAYHYGGIGAWAAGSWYTFENASNNIVRIGRAIKTKKPQPSYFSLWYTPLSILIPWVRDGKVGRAIDRGYQGMWRGIRKGREYVQDAFVQSYRDRKYQTLYTTAQE